MKNCFIGTGNFSVLTMETFKSFYKYISVFRGFCFFCVNLCRLTKASPGYCALEGAGVEPRTAALSQVHYISYS